MKSLGFRPVFVHPRKAFTAGSAAARPAARRSRAARLGGVCGLGAGVARLQDRPAVVVDRHQYADAFLGAGQFLLQPPDDADAALVGRDRFGKAEAARLEAADEFGELGGQGLEGLRLVAGGGFKGRHRARCSPGG